MFEYLIQRIDGDWFDLPADRLTDILRPADTPSRRIDGWGTNRICVEGEEISFSDEEVGIQVSFESEKLPQGRADQLMEEIRQNIESKTGQGAKVIQISF